MEAYATCTTPIDIAGVEQTDARSSLARNWTKGAAVLQDGATLTESHRPPPDRDRNTVGGRLRATRRGAGLSQGQLEALSGIPKARLSRYEHDHVAPSIHTFIRLCRALGVPPGELLDAIYPSEEPATRPPGPGSTSGG